MDLNEAWRRERKSTARQIALELARHAHVVSVNTVARWLVRLGINRRRDLYPEGRASRRPAPIITRHPGKWCTWTWHCIVDG
nr:hypothetical protein [Georgenia faecalis]